jgi:phosphoglycerate dehydrogenase-like enzyme
MIAVTVPAALRPMFFPPDVWDRLAALDELTDVLDEADVAVTSWGFPPLSAEALDAAPNLRLVVHTGASLRPFATPEAFARGVRLSQAGAAMAHAVAEQALTLTLALLHQVHRFDHGLRRGQPWHAVKASARPRRELRGCPVGVVGASRTGRAYIELLRAVGARVTVADPYAADLDTVPLDEVFRGARVVSLHAPVLPETRGMIGARELALLPEGAALVNTARSALVDGDALHAELASGRIDAAIDVFDEEPLPVDHPLRRMPNVLLTPHEAGGTVEARRRAGEIVVAEIARFRAGEPLLHEITPALLARMG